MVSQVWQWQVDPCRRSGSSSGITDRAVRLSGVAWLPSHDSSDHRDRPDSADPTLANDSDEIADPNDPIEPMDSTDPTLPIDSTE